MKHVPVLLCGAIIAGAVSPIAMARDTPHATAALPHALQRPGRVEAAPQRVGPATSGDESVCLSGVADDPDAALDQAKNWERHGGGAAAAHCAALATIALGDPDRGAAELDDAAHAAGLPAARRALLEAEASRAWLLAGRPERALAASALAAGLDPAPEYVVDHARAALATHQPDQAVQVLSPLLAGHPTLTDALIVRATALRQTGALDRARSDIDAACRLQPDDPDALLERGILRERAGDLDGARDDWSRVVASSPDTHQADLAQQDLALLDAGPEAR